MPSTDELYFMRALERCEKQLSAGFTDPLDSAQVRRLANIEHLLSEYGRRDGSSRNGKCQSRVDSVKKGAQPWIEKRDALVESLRTIHALKPNADETADTGGKDASPVSASNAEVKGNAESQNAEDSSSSSSSSVVADSRPAEPAPAVQAPTGTNADADQSQTENKRGDPKPKAAEEPKSTRKERSGFAEKRQGRHHKCLHLGVLLLQHSCQKKSLVGGGG
ncbi:hypothetical protein GQ54DRAFT_129913 [Martensiomyces pterosporus]|nr:hypothetical protein GQ54DRAFT_129913 [Martensiomyces pterosporus]